jgi:hypothetical protein
MEVLEMGRIGSSSLSERIVAVFIVYALGFLQAQLALADEKVPPESLCLEPFSDAHAHIIDFLQNGEFDNSDGRFQGVDPRGRIQKSSSVRYLALPYGEQWRRLTL